MKAIAFGMAGVVLAVQVGGALAQGACPTAADLQRGIRVDFADGSHETFRAARGAAEGASIIVNGVDADGFGYQMELGQGLHLVAYRNMTDGVADAGSELVYDYGTLPADLPLPVAGGRWSSPVTVTDQFGTRSEPQTHAWSEVMAVDIGGCVYDMIEAVISYKTGDGYRESVEYLPALGFGYLVWNESVGVERVPVPPVSIRVASKS